MLIKLNKAQYDPFIDYLKGICILFVVLAHCLPKQDYILLSLWGQQSVPLFLLIQVFHAYKKGEIDINRYYNFKKLWHRIIFPFLLLVFVQVVLMTIVSDNDLLSILKGVVISGGIGPGSYYVWIYLQFFILLPVFLFFIKQIKKPWLLLCFVLLSVLSELICSYIDPPFWLYRLLFVRYLFLVYLGYMWTINNGVKIDRRAVFLSLVSIFFILLFQYTNIKMEPIFYDNNIKVYHWICYFYTAYLFVYLIDLCYRKLTIGGG